MADFCFQCSLELFCPPPGDLNNLCSKASGDYVVAICEGCGITRVDCRGWCISPHCYSAHGEPSPGQLERWTAVYTAYQRRQGWTGLPWRLWDRLLGSPWEPG